MLSNLEIKDISYSIKIQCAWCGLDMGIKECEKEQDGKISHSICSTCEGNIEEEVI